MTQAEPLAGMQPIACWLLREDGTRVRVDRHGVLVGRDLGNDVIVRDEATSAIQALVRLGSHGPELRSLGRNPTRVGGEAIEGVRRLVDGDRIEMPGEVLRVIVVGEAIAASDLTWLIVGPSGATMAVHRELTLGGGPDDLVIPGWPPEAVQLRLAQGWLFAETRVPVETVGGTLQPGDLYACRPADAMAIDGVRIRLIGEPNRADETTIVELSTPLPHEARFEFLANGGQLTLAWPSGKASIRLTEVRARLVAILLGASGGYDPDRWHPDELLIPQVWPRAEGKTRVDVNILVHRVRQDLLRAHLNAFALLEREDRATRFRLQPGARVSVG